MFPHLTMCKRSNGMCKCFNNVYVVAISGLTHGAHHSRNGAWCMVHGAARQLGVWRMGRVVGLDISLKNMEARLLETRYLSTDSTCTSLYM